MFLTTVQIALLVYLLCLVIKNHFINALVIFTPIYGMYRILKKETICRLYEDRIEFLNTVFEEKIFTSIPFSDIIQVRYEDNFSQENPFFSMGHFAKIYLYLDMNNEYYKNSKRDRVIINVVQSQNREQLLIDILETFKEKNIEFFISTKYKRLLKELELKNWTAP